MKQTRWLTIILLAVIWGVGGCNSNPSGKFNLYNRRITILTEPAGASVTQLRPFDQPSMNLGKTPLEDQSVSVLYDLQVKNMSFGYYQNTMRHVGNVVVRIEKDGYEPYFGTLRVAEDETIVHEIKLIQKGP